MLAKIHDIIKERFEESDYVYHILVVVKYAKKLGNIYNADEETVELAALLHDIGRADIKNDSNHHIIGVSEATKILKEFNYSNEIIQEVAHCVESHRGSCGPEPKTLIAKIIANADAMSHFDIFPVFYFWKAKRNESVGEITKWVEEKLKRNWDKKLTLQEARELVEKKYEAIKQLIDLVR